MKLLERFLAKRHANWERSRLLKPWIPLLDAIDAFLLRRAENAREAPFMRDRIDIKRYMMMVVIALIPATIAAVYFWGWRCVWLIVVSYLFGGAAEVIFSVVRKEEVNEGFLVTGILFPLTLPASTPWWVVALGIVFGVVIGKEIFGGTGKNFFNPALVARVFVYISFPLQTAAVSMLVPNAAPSGWPGGFALWDTRGIQVDATSSATPLSARKAWVRAEDEATRDAAFAEIPSWRPMLLGTTRGCMGETSALLLALGGLMLVVWRIASWRIILATLVSAAAFSGIMNAAGLQSFAPPLYTLLSGGLMLGACFMATDPVSAPGTRQAQWFYGGVIGVMTCTIRALSGFPEGVMFAILFANVFASLMDYVVFKARYRRRRGVRSVGTVAERAAS
ncbi:MAG: RnfABCDGE type electron transport complex subunit D [Verrucomicrobia bacterium]|nr:RnfABCDGE type electron transport complex subunit D [Verrucomicrobiota bacterium]